MLEPFRYQFFVNAALVATIAGALCGLVGVYVVLRGMSYIGHGLSHAVFGWAVAGFIAQINFYIAAGVGGVLSALMIGAIARRRIIGADAAIGVVTTGIFALGLALISRSRSFTQNFEAALFGNVLGVTGRDVAVVLAVAVLVSIVVFVRYRQLLFSTFDPEVAEISGVPARRTDLLLSIILAATIVATMQVLGVTLVAAALVIPAVIARLLTDRFAWMLWLSTGIGAISGFAGVLLSFYLNIASGAAVVLVGSTIFILVFFLSRDSGSQIERNTSNASST